MTNHNGNHTSAHEHFTECTQKLGDLAADMRVKYVLGQVLGVKEFQQDQVYFLHKDRSHNRHLHGYGTVWGLNVTVTDSEGNIEVIVDPGVAIDRLGREIRVPTSQCAEISTWIEANLKDIPLAENRVQRMVHVVLCYDECCDEQEPIFGDPCRTENQSMEFTRIRDDFRIDLTLTPPQHPEERLIKDLGAFLGIIEIRSSQDDSSIDADDSESPTSPRPDDLTGPIPGGTMPIGPIPGGTIPIDPILPIGPKPIGPVSVLRLFRHYMGLDPAARAAALETWGQIILPQEEASEMLREIFLAWVTIHRPKIIDAENQEDTCLLLASINFKKDETAENWILDGHNQIINDVRPYLLHTRLLQEWLINGKGPKGDKGDKGDEGEAGPYVNLRTAPKQNPDRIEWKRSNQSGSAWQSLVTFDQIRGPQGQAGAEVELRKNTSSPDSKKHNIQWKRTNQQRWKELIKLDEIRGPAGSGQASRVQQQYFPAAAMNPIGNLPKSPDFMPISYPHWKMTPIESGFSFPRVIFEGNFQGLYLVWGIPDGGSNLQLSLRWANYGNDEDFETHYAWSVGWNFTRSVLPEDGQTGTDNYLLLPDANSARLVTKSKNTSKQPFSLYKSSLVDLKLPAGFSGNPDHLTILFALAGTFQGNLPPRIRNKWKYVVEHSNLDIEACIVMAELRWEA